MITHHRRYPPPPHTYHYDATNGLNTNTGAADKPLQTVADANARVLKPRDRVVFNKGETWAAQLIPASSGRRQKNILFGAYGVGADPIVRQFSIANATQSYITVQNIKFNGGVAGSVVAIDTHDILMQDCDVTGSTDGHGISAWSETGSVLYNIILRRVNIYSNYTIGIFIGSDDGTAGPHDCLIDTCVSYSNGHDTTLHHGIYVKYGVTVKNCTAYSNVSSGIQSEDGGIVSTVYKPVIIGNKCYSNQDGIMINHAYTKVINNLCYANTRYNAYLNAYSAYAELYHNTFVNATGSGGIRCDGPFASDVWHWKWKNNIIVQSVNPKVPIKVGDPEVLSQYGFSAAGDCENNCYYVDGVAGTAVIDWQNLAQWQANDNHDSGGIIGNPTFVNVASDWHLQTTSPCKNTGLDLRTTVPNDYDQVLRDATPDMGAFEYV